MKIQISRSSVATESAELQHNIGDEFLFRYARQAARDRKFSYEQGQKLPLVSTCEVSGVKQMLSFLTHS